MLISKREMTKRKKKELLPWCWYCDREFADEKILVQHQKAKHFKCTFCNRKLNTASGMVVHVAQVHKENIERVPNAIEGRDSVDLEIFGMEGVPPEDLQAHYEEIETGQKKPKQESLRPSGPSNTLLLKLTSYSNFNPANTQPTVSTPVPPVYSQGMAMNAYPMPFGNMPMMPMMPFQMPMMPPALSFTSVSSLNNPGPLISPVSPPGMSPGISAPVVSPPGISPPGISLPVPGGVPAGPPGISSSTFSGMSLNILSSAPPKKSDPIRDETEKIQVQGGLLYFSHPEISVEELRSLYSKYQLIQ